MGRNDHGRTANKWFSKLKKNANKTKIKYFDYRNMNSDSVAMTTTFDCFTKSTSCSKNIVAFFCELGEGLLHICISSILVTLIMKNC
jgi:hypothetical protein